jgi:hypothetical protein
MTIKVKTMYLSAFNMPRKCVSCGADTLSDKKWKVRWGQLEKDKHTLAIDFPLCDECGFGITKNSKKGARAVKLTLLLLSPFLCMLSNLGVSSFFDEKSNIGVIVGWVVFFIVILLAFWLSNVIDTSGMTPDQKREWKLQNKRWTELHKKLGRCAKINKVGLPGLFDTKNNGSIEFEFENYLFAMEFADLNLGMISSGK